MHLIRRPPIVFPLLLAVYPILNLYATNVDRLRVRDAIGPLAISLAAALVLLVVLRLLVRDGIKAGLLVGVIAILFFSYGHVQGALAEVTFGELAIGQHVVLLPLWAILFASAVFGIVKAGSKARPAIPYLNLVGGVLVAMPLLTVSLYTIRTPLFSPQPIGAAADAGTPSEASDTLPDIYYIILDGYARSDALEEFFDYDNSEFLANLESKGFYTAAESHSNYAQTFLSLASSLNMQYLDDVAVEMGTNSRDRALPYRMIQDSEVARILKSRGYTIVSFSSGWGPTDYNPLADVNYEYRSLNEFQTVLIETTLLSPISQRFVSADRRDKILYNLDRLGEVPTEVESPKFVFAHVLAPHPPYVFDRNGRLVNPDEGSYIDQLIYVNSQVEVLVEKLLARSDTPPVIILQGDHGKQISREDWQHARKVLSEGGEADPRTSLALRSRLSILNAYYLPGDAQGQLYPTITPVNSFRLVLDSYLGTDLGLLEDKVYYSAYDYPYEFYEVEPSGNAVCERLADGYDQVERTLFEWQEAHGQPVDLILNSSPIPSAYNADGLNAVEPWPDEETLRHYLVTWTMNGDAIFFVDELPSLSIPDEPLGITLETVDTVPVQCGDAGFVLRVRQVADEGPQIRRSIYEVVFPNPDDYGEQYRAIALHLIDTGAGGAVVVYPPSQFDLLDSRLQWGTEISGVYALGDSWPLDTQAVADTLEELAAEHAELHIVFLEETNGDPGSFIRSWLDEHLTLVSQAWFGPVELLSYRVPGGA